MIEQQKFEVRGEYTKVDRRTKISIRCLNCLSFSDRTFEQLYKYGGKCRACLLKDKSKKISEKLSASAKIHCDNLNEYIVNKLKDVFNDIDYYDYSKVIWNGKMANSKVTIICNKHENEWSSDIRNLLNGHGCKKCGTERTKNKAKKDFVKESKEKFGDLRFDYSKIDYKNAHQYVTLKCNIHNEEFTVIAREHLIATSGGCPSCYKINRSGENHSLAVPIEELKKRIKETWGDEYSYDLTGYTHLNSYITITCKKHSYTWESTASNHVNPISARGCRKCGLEATANSLRMPQEEFINRVSLIHSNKYNYNKVVYTNNATRVIVECKKHGDFLIAPSMHLDGYGCPSCSGKGVSKGQIEWLDSIQKESTDDIIYKGGKHNREETFKFNKKLYRTDGYCKEIKTVYEFLGCWYHGCPKCYNGTKIHHWKKIPMKELYEEFMERKRVFEENGYIMVHIWECEWNMKKCAYRIQVGDQEESEISEKEEENQDDCLIMDD